MKNFQPNNLQTTNVYTYDIPAAYFSRVDFDFRISFDVDINICNVYTNTNKSINAGISRNAYRRVLFRFFRLCNA